jgi:hypothetical protein
MTDDEKGAIVLFCWLGFLAIPFVLMFLSYSITFITRGDSQPELTMKYIQLTKLYFPAVRTNDDCVEVWFCIHMFAGGFLAFIVAFMWIEVSVTAAIVSFSILGSPLVLRVLYDIMKALAYNFKSGKAERIDKLEAEIQALKDK